jgi:EmrB/QacA subfamily drug resistance transporter
VSADPLKHDDGPQPEQELRAVAARPHLELSRRNRMWVTAGVMLGMFLAALEATVVSTAMPTVIASLGGIERYSWVFSVYMLTSTVTVPVWGKLSDLYGRRRLFQIGIAIFLVGSILSGLAGSMAELIAWRALQGLGAGALIPLALTIVGEIFTLEERARMQGVFSGVWGLASIIGPLAGGYITDNLSWRWVFYINIPFGLLSAAIIGWMLVEPRRAERPSIDYAGAVTLTASMTLLLFGLVEGGNLWGYLSAPTIAIFAASAALLALFFVAELRAVEPIVPLELFKDVTFSSTTLCGFFVGTAMFGTISYIPLFIQGVTGASATTAGSALTPLMLAWVTMSVIGGRLLHRVGVRPLVVTGVSILVVGFFALTFFGRGASLVLLMADMALIGVGMGLVMLTILIAVQAVVPKHRLGVATSLSMFARSIGGAIGVAVMGAVLSMSLASRIEGLGVAVDPNQLLDPHARDVLAPETLAALQTALAESLRGAFWIGTVVAVLALISAFWLPRRLADSRG